MPVGRLEAEEQTDPYGFDALQTPPRPADKGSIQEKHSASPRSGSPISANAALHVGLISSSPVRTRQQGCAISTGLVRLLLLVVVIAGAIMIGLHVHRSGRHGGHAGQTGGGSGSGSL